MACLTTVACSFNHVHKKRRTKAQTLTDGPQSSYLSTSFLPELTSMQLTTCTHTHVPADDLSNLDTYRITQRIHKWMDSFYFYRTSRGWLTDTTINYIHPRRNFISYYSAGHDGWTAVFVVFHLKTTLTLINTTYNMGSGHARRTFSRRHLPERNTFARK